jgi:hypothetical protein
VLSGGKWAPVWRLPTLEGLASTAVYGAPRQKNVPAAALDYFLRAMQTMSLVLPGKAYLTAFVTRLVHNEPDRNCPIGRQELASHVGLELDGRAVFLVY